MSAWEAVIGLEVHVQVRTASKLFCACANRYGAEPNTLVCPVCMGYPGVMPVPNREAIRRTIAAGLMCGCRIARFSKFDRKSYFYPDMPKNYQISQYDLPFCAGGGIRIGGTGFSGAELPERTIGLTRIHLEEDVAKSSHLAGCSGIDFNRAGVPLMEIVSEPDMRTPDEAYAYLAALKQIMQYAGIGDCDMEKGQLRCDVNVSVRRGPDAPFGTKIEIKNLNSFRSVHRALAHEIGRQQAVLEAGGSLVQETRAWNDEAGETFLLRRKESAHDYRYFPEPDLMPMTFTDHDIEAIRAALPELPEARRARFVADFALTAYDAAVLTAEKPLADYFEAAAAHTRSPKILANWILSELMRELGGAGVAITACRIAPEALAELVECIQDGTVSGRIAKDVFAAMFRSGDAPRAIIAAQGLVQVSDADAIGGFVDAALAANPAQAEQYRGGNPKVLQFLVGQVMKLSKGKANPQLVNELLRKRLDG